MVRSLSPCRSIKSLPGRPMHYPDFEEFQRLAGEAQLVAVYRRLLSDSLTPVTAFHKIDSGSCACLFESFIGGE